METSRNLFSINCPIAMTTYISVASEAKIAQGIMSEYGFHTNKKTKPLIISNMVACLRDEMYIERNILSLDEMATYEKKQNGSFGATDGNHDDMVMVRAIGLFICFCEMELPKIIEEKPKFKPNKVITEATI